MIKRCEWQIVIDKVGIWLVHFPVILELRSFWWIIVKGNSMLNKTELEESQDTKLNDLNKAPLLCNSSNVLFPIRWIHFPRWVCRLKFLTLISKSWKTHPKIFPKFQFSGHELNRFLENSSKRISWVPIQFSYNFRSWARLDFKYGRAFQKSVWLMTRKTGISEKNLDEFSRICQ